MIARFIKRKITTVMLYLGLCLVGLIALQRLPVQLLPNIDFPRLTVITPYENAIPGEIESLVTRYIEEAVSSVNGVLSIQSESIEGLSLVTARFAWGTNMDMALVETKEKVDLVKGELPQDTEKSIVVKYDPRSEPIMIYSVTSKSGDFRDLRRRVTKELVPYLERIEGVAVVDVAGGFQRQINIDLDAAKIYSHGLSLAEVMEGVSAANYNFPAGYIIRGGREFQVRTVGEFKNLDQVRKVVVGRNEAGVPVYLEQIAQVTDDFKDQKEIVRCDGAESVALLIRKEPGKNTVATCERVIEEMRKIGERHRGDIAARLIYDESAFITDAVDNVFWSAVIGGIIAVLVIWFFLLEIRSPLIIAVNIPIAIIGTFAVMHFRGITLNTISLGGLAIAVGMMIDDSIVVLESIAIKRAEMPGAADFDQVLAGVKDVFVPVLASMLSTIVIFIPIVFLRGLAGAIFGELALTITITQVFSLVSALTLVPMLATLHPKLPERFANLSGRLDRIHERMKVHSDRFTAFAERLYEKGIALAVDHKKEVFMAAAASLVLGLVLFNFVGAEVMPRVDPGEFTIDISMPRGTPLAESGAMSETVEKTLRALPYVRSVYAKIGSDPEENIAERISGRKSHNIALKVLLTTGGRPHINDVVRRLRRELKFGSEITVEYLVKESVVESMLTRRRKPVHVEIYGGDFAMLRRYGDEVKKAIGRIPGLEKIEATFDKREPELTINVDRTRIASLGISIADLAATIRAAVHGEVATRYRDKDDEIDMRVRLRESDRSGAEALYRILVKSASGETVPVEQFATIDEGSGSSVIIRNEQSRVNIVSADFPGDPGDIIDRVSGALSSLPLAEGYSLRIVGALEEMGEIMKEMRFAFILAVVLIYMLLAAQFQSLRNPLIVMMSIPVASLGVSAALLVTGKTLNVNSAIGIILLAGTVVKNAIVLFDCVEAERAMGMPVREALVMAGKRRLRPILMTTFSTIFAIIPIALGIGQGAELEQPMAVTIIGGLAVSTALTLIFIPTVYAWFEERRG